MSLLALDARRGTPFSGCFLPRQDKATGARAGVELHEVGRKMLYRDRRPK